MAFRWKRLAFRKGLAFRRWLVFLALLVACQAAPARAAYPDRPVRIIVATTPGGGYDLVGRLVADQLQRKIGGAWVVENVPGAGSLVGTRQAAHLAPDGYGLMVGGLSNLVLNQGLYASPGYDSVADFVPIGLVFEVPYAMIARKDLGGSLQEIIANAKKNPGALNVGTAGPGTGQDVLARLFASLAGIKITVIPYRGSAPVYPDLMAGRVDLYIDALSTAQPQITGGSVRGIATLGTRRAAAMPELPTIAEAGLPQLTAFSWLGLFAPAKTPAPVVQTLREGLEKAVADPGYREKVAASGGEVMDLIGDPAEALVKSQMATWLPMMKNAGIELQ